MRSTISLIRLPSLWVYTYFPRFAPEPEVEMPLAVPFSHRFDVRCERRPRESLFFRRYFDTITAAEPWAPLPDTVREQYAGARETARFRVLLEEPVCRAWYLGERFLWQTLGLPEQVVPTPPPLHIRHTVGDYIDFIQTHLMWPVASIRRDERERPVVPVGGAGAWRATQARDQSGSRRGRGVEWPELPTTMKCRGQGGETSQIPIAPPPADHKLVRVRGSTPASIEYTGQSLELTASVIRMLQRSINLQTIYGIPAPFQILAVGVRHRSRAGHTHSRSSSQAPVPDDDESDAEAESSQDETRDGSDSGSESGAGGDDPGPSSRKRTRTYSRA
ncbi:hypothetical protein CsSME_00037612 [Camellia sinensis var. sinensis]